MTDKYDKTLSALKVALENLNLERDISLAEYYRLEEDMSELIEMWKFEDTLRLEEFQDKEIGRSIVETGAFSTQLETIH